MGNEKAARIQTSILNKAEKKALVWLAKRQPRWMTSDALTLVGIIGALLSAAGYVLCNWSLQWLWLSSAGLVINWYGDSLDGTMARVRHTQRPVYGFFIDHNVDIFTLAVVCFAAGISPLLKFSSAMLVLAAYLAITAHTYIGTILKDEFKLTYGKLGPTEFRLLIIIFNTVLIYIPWQEWRFDILGRNFGIFDIFAIAVAAIIFILCAVSFFQEKRYFEKIDPVKPFDGHIPEE